jgi:Ca2+-binding RTX toxin-like protein
MATLNVGDAGPLDMSNLQIAALQNGGDPIYDANLIRVDNGDGHFDDFHGQGLSYAGGGYYGYGMNYDPVGGVITGVTEISNGAVLADISGVSVDAPTLFQALRSHDVSGMLGMLLGGDDVVNGAGGADSLDGLGGADTMSGGDGADSMRGLDGNDQLDGGAGGDDVNGNLGADVVHGGDGADSVLGGQGEDKVFGDAGDDPMVNGNIGEDEVHGGIGADSVYGGQGNDLVLGEDGDDQLSGDLGSDTLTGGAGADRFLFRPGSSHDVISDFNAAEGDRIALPAGVGFTVANVNGEAVIDLGGGDQLTLSGVAFGSFNTAWVLVG